MPTMFTRRVPFKISPRGFVTPGAATFFQRLFKVVRCQVLEGCAALACIALMLIRPAWGETKAYDLENEVVCRVNTQVVSKRDVEVRMISSGDAMLRLFLFRERLKSESQWNEENQEKFNEIYLPSFREELRACIKEKLMLAEAKRLGAKVNRTTFDKQFNRVVEQYRQQNVINKPGFTFQEIKNQLNERLLIDEFRQTFVNVFDMPKRPSVQKYYEEHLKEYQRGPAVKVRQIRICSVKTDSLGRQVFVPDAKDRADELRRDVVDLNADFEDLARTKSDDPEELRKRGGLLAMPDGDSFINPSDKFPAFAKAAYGLKPGDVSKVFEFTDRSWGFVKLEARREASSRPLDEKLYNEIHDLLLQGTIRKKEDEWFKKAIEQNLIVGIQDGKETELPMSFYFPDDPQYKTQAKPTDKDSRTATGNTK